MDVFGQYISNTELLDLWQLCEINEKQYNMGPLRLTVFSFSGQTHFQWESYGQSYDSIKIAIFKLLLLAIILNTKKARHNMKLGL